MSLVNSQISNVVLQAGTLEKINSNLRDSKFDPSKSRSFQGHKGLSIYYVDLVAFVN